MALVQLTWFDCLFSGPSVSSLLTLLVYVGSLFSCQFHWPPLQVVWFVVMQYQNWPFFNSYSPAVSYADIRVYNLFSSWMVSFQRTCSTNWRTEINYKLIHGRFPGLISARRQSAGRWRLERLLAESWQRDAVFSSKFFSQKVLQYPSHRILRYVHGSLNIDEKN